MIKIHLARQQDILDFHYSNLTTRVGRQQNVLMRIEKRIRAQAGSPDKQAMYEDLLVWMTRDENGYSLLTAPPGDLANFILLFEAIHDRVLTPEVIADMENIFYYCDYDKWKAYPLAQQINCPVCPYCNRAYTFVFDKSTKRTRFEYDHFFSKARYPYLALCFFNLVPSCHTCNAGFKGTKQFTLEENIHPYLDGFGEEMVFYLDTKDIGFTNGKANAYQVALRKGLNATWDAGKVAAARNNFEIFGLSTLYTMHNDYVDEIIQKALIYSPAYIDSLYKQFEGKLFSSPEDVKRMLLSNYVFEEDFGKRVLSKLTADIARDLKLI